MVLPWYWLALGSALLGGVGIVVQKKILFKEHATEFSTVFSLVTFLLVLPFLFWADLSLTLPVLGLVYIESLLTTVAFLFATKAVRHAEISAVVPFHSFTPAFVTVLAFFSLGESLAAMQILGIAFLIGGSYLLEANHHFSDLLRPFRAMFRSRAIKDVLFAIVLYSIASIIGRYLLLETNPGHVDPWTFLLLTHAFTLLNFLLLLVFFYDGWAGIRHGFRTVGWLILLAAVLAVGSRTFYLFAVAQEAAKIGLVSSITRLSLIASILLGGEVFHEHHLRLRLLVALIMLIGVYLITL